MQPSTRSAHFRWVGLACAVCVIGALRVPAWLIPTQANAGTSDLALSTVAGMAEVAATPSALEQTQAQVVGVPDGMSGRTFKSLGLGRKRADWEAENGQARDEGRWKVYKGGAFRVLFVNDHVWHLRHQWNVLQAPHLAQIRNAIKERLPDDLQLVSSSAMSERLLVETYYSASLSEQFGSGVKWPGTRRAGTFIVLYHIDSHAPGGDAVTLLEIKAGNNLLADNH